MGGVSSAIQEPDGASVGTVEPRATTTWSLSLSTDTPPEVARPQKPEVAPNIVQQPSCPGALLTITDRRRMFVSALGEPDNRSIAAVHCPFHTGTGNIDADDVTPIVGRGQSAYSGTQLAWQESSSEDQPARLKCYSDAQLAEPEIRSDIWSARQEESHIERSQSAEPERIHL